MTASHLVLRARAIPQNRDTATNPPHPSIHPPPTYRLFRTPIFRSQNITKIPWPSITLAPSLSLSLSLSPKIYRIGYFNWTEYQSVKSILSCPVLWCKKRKYDRLVTATASESVQRAQASGGALSLYLWARPAPSTLELLVQRKLDRDLVIERQTRWKCW